MTDSLAIDLLTLPDGALARACLFLAQTSESAAVAEHSIRSFLYARLLAAREGSVADTAYDETLLFAACVLHDLGLGHRAPAHARFEVEGADLAAELLLEHGVGASDVARVWEAIALHSSIGIADRMGLLTSLTHRGVFTDAGRWRELPDTEAAPVRRAYPRPAGDTSIRDAIVAHASRSEAAAPPFSIAAEFLRQARLTGRPTTARR